MKAPNFTTPRQAVAEMLAAGAIFSVVRRDDALGMSFSYQVAANGDAPRCCAILADVKGRPPAFFAAFKMHVQDAVAAAERGAA